MEYVEIMVDGLPAPVTLEESKDPNIADKVRARRAELILIGEEEALDYDALVGDDSDGVE